MNAPLKWSVSIVISEVSFITMQKKVFILAIHNK